MMIMLKHIVLCALCVIFYCTQHVTAGCHESCATCFNNTYDGNGCYLCAPGFYPAADQKNRITYDIRPGPCAPCLRVSYCTDGSYACDTDGSPCVNTNECIAKGGVVTAAQASITVPMTAASYALDYVREHDCATYYPLTGCAGTTNALVDDCLDRWGPDRECYVLFGPGYWSLHPEVGTPLGMITKKSNDDVGTHLFRIQPFSSKNAAVILPHPVYWQSEMDLLTPGNYSRLYLYCFTGQGVATVNVWMIYEDGSLTDQNVTCPDWLTTGRNGFNLTARVTKASNVFDYNGTGTPTLFENALTNITSTKRLTSLNVRQVHCIGPRCVTTVWAVSGVPLSPPVCSVNATASVGHRSSSSSTGNSQGAGGTQPHVSGSMSICGHCIDGWSGLVIGLLVVVLSRSYQSI